MIRYFAMQSFIGWYKIDDQRECSAHSKSLLNDRNALDKLPLDFLFSFVSND